MSTLVEMLTHAGGDGGTENTVLGRSTCRGPLTGRWASPCSSTRTRATASSSGTITDPDGTPIGGHARLLAERHGRLLRRAAAGRADAGGPASGIYDRRQRRHLRRSRPVRPGALPRLPSDGPAGDLLHGRRAQLDASGPPHVVRAVAETLHIARR